MTSFKSFGRKTMFIGMLSLAIVIVLFSCTPPATDDTNGGNGTTNTNAVDTTAPTVSITSPADYYATNMPSVTVSGVATITNTTGVLITNIVVGASSTITNSSGNVVAWSTNINLTIGTNTIVITANSDNGKSGSDTVNVIYDTNAPVLANITPVNNQTNYSANYTLQGTVSDLSTVTVYIKLDNGSFVGLPVSGGNWSTNYTALAYGSHTNWVYAVDELGYTSTTNQISNVVVYKKIIADDGAANDWFGSSVAMSADGNTVIIGASSDVVGANDNQGSAYWLRTTDGGISWNTNKLTASDGDASDYFGCSVAMSGDGNTVVIGAYGDDDQGSVAGAAYWLRTADGGSTWDTNKLVGYDCTLFVEFGRYSVAISDDGDTVIVGATEFSGGGAAYWFRTADDGVTWDTNKLIAYDRVNNDRFGGSVAMSADGNTVIVGASWCNVPTDDEGAAYWFRTADDGVTWNTNKLFASDAAVSDWFGTSVAMSADGNTVIVGAIGNNEPTDNEGAAYRLYTSDNGITWTTNKLTAFDGAVGDSMGYSVAMSASGNTVIVGAQGVDSSKGAIYRLQTSDAGSTWTTNKFIAYGVGNSSYFGNRVAISDSGNAWISSCRAEDIGANNSQGSAYWWGE